MRKPVNGGAAWQRTALQRTSPHLPSPPSPSHGPPSPPRALTVTAAVRGAVGSGDARMKIVVDLNRCQGYAQCAFLAPAVFEIHGEEALIYAPRAPARVRERVRRAV